MTSSGSFFTHPSQAAVWKLSSIPCQAASANPAAPDKIPAAMAWRNARPMVAVLSCHWLARRWIRRILLVFPGAGAAIAKEMVIAVPAPFAIQRQPMNRLVRSRYSKVS